MSFLKDKKSEGSEDPPECYHLPIISPPQTMSTPLEINLVNMYNEPYKLRTIEIKDQNRLWSGFGGPIQMGLRLGILNAILANPFALSIGYVDNFFLSRRRGSNPRDREYQVSAHSKSPATEYASNFKIKYHVDKK